MARSKFATEKTRDAGNDGGETRLKVRTSTGLYQTIAHFSDEAMARSIARLLNSRGTQMDERAKARATLDDQTELLPIDHESMHPDRRKKFFTGAPNPEAFYIAAWRRLNSNKTGQQYLAHILCPQDKRKQGFTMWRYSRRDAVVAASVIQWLGTNVGRGFVLGVERELEEARKTQQKVRDVRRRSRPNVEPKDTPLERRKKTLDATRERLANATKGNP
jgi:hypothetical protein